MKKTTLNWLCFVIFVFAAEANAEVVKVKRTPGQNGDDYTGAFNLVGVRFKMKE